MPPSAAMHRHSSPSTNILDLRPVTFRNRSTSLPIVDALGCSTAEAELIMAEGKAAVRKRSCRRPSHREETDVYRPRDHMKYLSYDPSAFQPTSPTKSTHIRHSRIPSNATDTSTATVTDSHQPHVEKSHVEKSHVEKSYSTGQIPGRPLETYSATLAQFIQSQLMSIPSYQTAPSIQTARTSISPHSCPNRSLQSKTPPQSPRLARRPMGIHSVVEIPPVRPPLQSAFSTWSSTDDDSDYEVQRIPTAASNYTPSILGFYENSNQPSFLFTSTPPHDEAPLDDDEDPLTAKGAAFPTQTGIPHTKYSPAHLQQEYSSSALSTRLQLSLSSAPSLSSTSTASYFDCKRPLSLSTQMRDRIIAAVNPNSKERTITATSPFEGDSIADVHDIFIESQQRVRVDGMSFDMQRDFNMPREGLMRMTPC